MIGSNPSEKTYKDYASADEVRWCPGCGDYAILKTMQKTLAQLNLAPENTVFVSGIGCAARFPYYMNTYGFHTIHGRAPTVATGLKLMRPELSVWVVTGDGDALSIGGNHLLHILRRNLDINILLFNNRIYGLTKGQYSPTSTLGQVAGTTPQGSIDRALSPLSVALAAGATFVARALDVDSEHLSQLMIAAHAHRGTAIIEIYQNCHIYNDLAFADLSNKPTRHQHALYVNDQQPLLYGEDHGLIAQDWQLTPVALSADNRAQVVTHNKASLALAYQLAAMEYPHTPVPMGILYQTEQPTYEALAAEQAASVNAAIRSPAELNQLLATGYTWQV